MSNNSLYENIGFYCCCSSTLVAMATKPNSCGSRLKSCETVPTMATVYDICRFCGVPNVQLAEDTQTMTHTRSTISLVVRVISLSKKNFYDVIRLKIIESRYFPKETVKVGLEKSKVADN